MLEPELASIGLKLDRAERHLQELKSLVLEHLHNNYPFDRNKVYTPGEAREINIAEVPKILSIVAADAINNLRSALDHLACRLAEKNGAKSIDKVAFAFGSTEEIFLEQHKRKSSGMSQQAQAFIRELKPYAGGNQLLYSINALSNVDKHRLLLKAKPELRLQGLMAHELAQIKDICYPDLFFPLKGGAFVASYNIMLDTPDVTGEQEIAKYIRQMIELTRNISIEANAKFFK